MPLPPPSIGLCLSGGGFRATLFHLGAIRRLNELGLLSRVAAISSASGGSITNGVLAVAWSELTPDAGGQLQGFEEYVAKPLRAFCRHDLRTRVLALEWLKPSNWIAALRGKTSTNLLANRYAESLGMDMRLVHMPQTPRFIFCACNLDTGVNWVFQRDGVGDYVTGSAAPGDMRIADAVAASSAFTLTFPPLELDFPAGSFSGGQTTCPSAVKTRLFLTDGGVYDNMALEPIWKDHDHVLVSYAGQPTTVDPGQDGKLWTALYRSTMIMLNQTQALRKRMLLDKFLSGQLKGTYWAVGTDYRHYGLTDAPKYPDDMNLLLEKVRIDFNRFSDGEIACLENHGYLLADLAVRRHVQPQLSTPLLATPFKWPFPEWVDAQKARAALADSGQMHVLRDLLSGLAFWRAP